MIGECRFNNVETKSSLLVAGTSGVKLWLPETRMCILLNTHLKLEKIIKTVLYSDS